MGQLQRIQHIGLCVADIDRSLAFYVDLLGLRLVERHEPGEGPLGPIGAAFLSCGQFHHDLVLFYGLQDTGERGWFGAGRQPSPPTAHIAFQVENRAVFEGVLARLRACDVPIVHGPVKHSSTHPDGDGTYGENRAFYIQDPDGHVIEIMCEMAVISSPVIV
ncbi:MAG: glyoxalase/bleomycin resistance protein/dioxygenase [Chloroflexi bacterium]|nr:glyoxalase/bleomycin resistance protein/dioxygenase [Chloroflexota bacterium]